MIPGGALRGDVAREFRPDLSLVESEQEVEIQVRSERPRSVATRMVVHGGELYVPAVLAFPFTRWPHQVVEDERVVLRASGLLYRARAVRVNAPELEAELRQLVAKKYQLDPQDLSPPDKMWFFWIDFPRGSVAQISPLTSR